MGTSQVQAIVVKPAVLSGFLYHLLMLFSNFLNCGHFIVAEVHLGANSCDSGFSSCILRDNCATCACMLCFSFWCLASMAALFLIASCMVTFASLMGRNLFACSSCMSSIFSASSSPTVLLAKCILRLYSATSKSCCLPFSLAYRPSRRAVFCNLQQPC